MMPDFLLALKPAISAVAPPFWSLIDKTKQWRRFHSSPMTEYHAEAGFL
jgi:hypothetical protein